MVAETQKMVAILGIDAAWTLNHRSGVALIRQMEGGKWQSVAVESSYDRFLGRSNRLPTGENGAVPASDLLRVAEELAGCEVKLMVADVPLSRVPILGRRCADNEVSRRFGRLGCSTHTPSAARPGPISMMIRDGLHECGFHLATRAKDLSGRALIETYPHPALLTLMNAAYRVPYKVGKTTNYWPNCSPTERKANLLRELREILAALSRNITCTEFGIPQDSGSFSALKPIEDKIDALVCAWVGIKVLEGKAEAIGDEEGAIWLPDGQA